jgi:hypothetical protein
MLQELVGKVLQAEQFSSMEEGLQQSEAVVLQELEVAVALMVQVQQLPSMEE